MRSINIHAAKTNLSRLVEQAAKGDAFIIAKAGKPLVKVVPINEADAPGHSRLGFLAGEFTVPDDFDRMDEAEIERMFAGET